VEPIQVHDSKGWLLRQLIKHENLVNDYVITRLVVCGKVKQNSDAYLAFQGNE